MMRKRYKKRTGIGLIAVVVLLICVVVAYRRIDLENERDKLQLKVEKLEKQMREQEERTTEIKNFTAYVQTKKYIEEIARDKLGLVYEDEIILKPIE